MTCIWWQTTQRSAEIEKLLIQYVATVYAFRSLKQLNKTGRFVVMGDKNVTTNFLTHFFRLEQIPIWRHPGRDDPGLVVVERVDHGDEPASFGFRFQVQDWNVAYEDGVEDLTDKISGH